MKRVQYCICIATYLATLSVQMYAADNSDASWNIALGLCISAEGPLKDERAFFDGPMVYGVGDVNSAEDYCDLETNSTYERKFIRFTADYIAEYEFDATEGQLVELSRYTVGYSLFEHANTNSGYVEASWIEDPETPDCKNRMWIRINERPFDDNKGMLETQARGYSEGCKYPKREVNRFMWSFTGFMPRFHRYIE